jgi:hypothetical protein
MARRGGGCYVALKGKPPQKRSIAEKKPLPKTERLRDSTLLP